MIHGAIQNPDHLTGVHALVPCGGTWGVGLAKLSTTLRKTSLWLDGHLHFLRVPTLGVAVRAKLGFC